MRRLLLSFIAVGVFGAAPLAFAACSQAYSCKCDGTTYPDITSQIPNTLETADASGICQSACSEKNANDTWSLLCGSSEVNQGTIPANKPEEVKKELSVPQLSVPIPGLTFTRAITKDGTIYSNYIGQYVEAIYSLVIVVASIGVILTIMISGLRWMAARGNASEVKNAQGEITKAFTSLAILLGVVSIVAIIDPDLTSLRGLAIKKIDLIPYTEDTGADVANLSLPDPNGGTNGVPYFSQRDFTTQYGDCDDGKGGKTTVKSSGCGPTSFAMALRYFGVSTDPSQVATTFANEGYRICGRGTNSAAFWKSSIAKSSGLNIRSMVGISPSSIDSELAAGRLVIISVGKSRFTGGGHFMLITGKSGNDYSLNDPNSGYKTITRQEVETIVKYGVSVGK